MSYTTKTHSVFAQNIFLKMAVVKVADCKADSAEFANSGRLLEVLQRYASQKDTKLRLRDWPTSLSLLILPVSLDF